MTPKLVSAEYVREYTVHVKFADGAEGDVDLACELWGEMFEPLKEPRLFREFLLNEELDTVSWPSGADLAPEFFYGKATAKHSKARDPDPPR